MNNVHGGDTGRGVYLVACLSMVYMTATTVTDATSESVCKRRYSNIGLIDLPLDYPRDKPKQGYKPVSPPPSIK